MDATTLTGFHPSIQCAVLRASDPALTFERLGERLGISKQAAEKHFKKGLAHLQAYSPGPSRAVAADLVGAKAEPSAQDRDEALIAHLRRRLILAGVEIQGLKFFRTKVLQFIPTFKVSRLPAREKKQLLDWFEKFQRAGGFIREFARAVGKSPETLARWQDAYDKHGLSGLVDKTTRPKHFGNKVPLWIRDALIALFLQRPNWTPFQYYSQIRNDPATHWYVSLPTIQKMKSMHREISEQEKERIRKRWCFAPGTKAWTVDFTCLLKTDNFKLQCLTVSDHRSRFLIHTALYLETSTETIMAELEELFLRYGKPDLLKADNGPEFRTEFREDLRELAVYVLNSPEYYGQFCGAHERIHRKMKAFIAPFGSHGNLMRLVDELRRFQDEYNYKMPMDSLGGKTPSEIFFGDGSFVPNGAEVVTAYEKDGEFRMKFTGRDGKPARISVPAIEPEPSSQ
jgi:transposase InsO family protein